MAAANHRPTINETELEPALRRIPEGWFWMGSESGQDNERPVHRVWVDVLLLAVRQVTNADYEHFLRATGALPPPFWEDPNFAHPEQPVVAISWFEALKYCKWLSSTTRRKYRLPTEAEWERAARGGVDGNLFPWGDEPPQSLPDYGERWKTGPEPAARYAPTTSTSGAATGMRPIIMLSRQSTTRGVRKQASDGHHAAGRGGTISKSPAAPPAPASHRSSSTPITAFGWRVICKCLGDLIL